jgi:hypothetical protein
MRVISNSVFSVLDQFPDHKRAIMRFFKEHEDFQDLCEDYRQCVDALRYWNRSDDKDAPARRMEYRTLLLELAAEILQYLNESKA